jgi:CHAT domain-containing protein
VILSACNSGGPDGVGGESLSGLARSFFYAHSQSLLVTHWNIQDNIAAALTVQIVAYLKDEPELGVTGALRKAQLHVLERAAAGGSPAWTANPFSWAPFVVIGEGGESGHPVVAAFKQ